MFSEVKDPAPGFPYFIPKFQRKSFHRVLFEFVERNRLTSNKSDTLSYSQTHVHTYALDMITFILENRKLETDPRVPPLPIATFGVFFDNITLLEAV